MIGLFISRQFSQDPGTNSWYLRESTHSHEYDVTSELGCIGATEGELSIGDTVGGCWLKGDADQMLGNETLAESVISDCGYGSTSRSGV